MTQQTVTLPITKVQSFPLDLSGNEAIAQPQAEAQVAQSFQKSSKGFCRAALPDAKI